MLCYSSEIFEALPAIPVQFHFLPGQVEGVGGDVQDPWWDPILEELLGGGLLTSKVLHGDSRCGQESPEHCSFLGCARQLLEELASSQEGGGVEVADVGLGLNFRGEERVREDAASFC